LLLRLRDEMGSALVVIEHDIPLVSSISDRLIALDQGRTFGLGRTEMRQQARPATPELPSIRGDDDEDGERRGGGGEEEEGGEVIEEVHEVLGNLLMFLVGGHVAYLLLFKRPLARFMLFLKPARRAEPASESRAGE
jgi:energy-coupling factor transporter ATP-binding protein EcfA2